MSMDHDLMVDRLSGPAAGTNTPKLSKQEQELARWQQQKQDLMVQQGRDYMEMLFKDNATRPVKIGAVEVHNSQLFRDAFIRKQIEPLIESNITTLERFFASLDSVTQNFKSSGGIENMYISLKDSPAKSLNTLFWALRGSAGSSSSSAISFSPVLHLVPVKSFYAKTGTNVGNGEGDGYIQFQLKNLFGGSESLVFDAVTGTKTQSSYLLNYTLPVCNNTSYVFEQLLYMNTKTLDWLQSDSRVKGSTTKLFTQFPALVLAVNHDVSVENCWRVLANNESRSLDVLAQLGNDFKLLLLYNCRYDTRDNVHLPTKGSLLRIGLEYAGLVSSCPSQYVKAVVELQRAVQVNDANAMIFTHKAGLLHTLGKSKSSHVLDRFYMGGPNDVRSFLLNGLGPKSFNLSVGGDLFVNGGVSLVTRIPKLDPDSNFKLHNFLNYGKLVLYDKQDPMSSIRSLGQLSVSYGFGVLYNHPMARFELNFVLPLYTHDRDYMRKGLQYGIGVSFL